MSKISFQNPCSWDHPWNPNSPGSLTTQHHNHLSPDRGNCIQTIFTLWSHHNHTYLLMSHSWFHCSHPPYTHTSAPLYIHHHRRKLFPLYCLSEKSHPPDINFATQLPSPWVIIFSQRSVCECVTQGAPTLKRISWHYHVRRQILWNCSLNIRKWKKTLYAGVHNYNQLAATERRINSSHRASTSLLGKPTLSWSSNHLTTISLSYEWPTVPVQYNAMLQ